MTKQKLSQRPPLADPSGGYFHVIKDLGEGLKSFQTPVNNVSPDTGLYYVSSVTDLDALISGAVQGTYAIIAEVTLDANKTLPGNVTLEFRNNAKILGGGFTLTVDATYIKANKTDQIFKNIVFDGFFTNALFYADWLITYIDAATDVYAEAQQAIIVARDNTSSNILQFGPKAYSLSFPLFIYKTSDGGVPNAGVNTYAFVNMEVYGTVKKYDSGQGTVLKATHKDKFVIGLQAGRSCVFKDFQVLGAGSYNINVTNLIDGTYVDPTLRDSQFSPYSGICIDPFASVVPADGGYPGMSDYYLSNTGSSVTTIKNVKALQVVIGFMLSPSNLTQINDSVNINNCEYNKVDTVVAIGQSQNRNITINNMHGLFLHTGIECADYGTGNASVPTVNGFLIAGAGYQMMNCPNNDWGGSGNFNNLFAESCWTVGVLGGKQVCGISGSTFKLYDYLASSTFAPSHHLTITGHVAIRDSYLGFYRGAERVLYCFVDNNSDILFDKCTFDDIPVTRNTSNQPRDGIFTDCHNSVVVEKIPSLYSEEKIGAWNTEASSATQGIVRDYLNLLPREVLNNSDDLVVNGDGTGVITTDTPAEYSSRIGRRVFGDASVYPIGFIDSVDGVSVNLVRCSPDISSQLGIKIESLGDYEVILYRVTGSKNSVPSSGDFIEGTYLNKYRKSGTQIGWRCLSSGAPGTWEEVHEPLFKDAVLDFGNILAGAQAELTIAMTGVDDALDWNVSASPLSGIEAGLVWSAYVSALNVVTIRLTNISAGAIDPSSTSWKVTATNSSK